MNDGYLLHSIRVAIEEGFDEYASRQVAHLAEMGKIHLLLLPMFTDLPEKLIDIALEDQSVGSHEFVVSRSQDASSNLSHGSDHIPTIW